MQNTLVEKVNNAVAKYAEPYRDAMLKHIDLIWERKQLLRECNNLPEPKNTVMHCWCVVQENLASDVDQEVFDYLAKNALVLNTLSDLTTRYKANLDKIESLSEHDITAVVLGCML